MRMFLGQQVRQEDPAMQRVYRNLKQNLEDMLGSAASSGVEVVLCTVARNLKDCAPFASLNRPDLTPTN